MTVKLTVLITEDLRRKAKIAAAERGVTLTQIIRDALERFVEEAEALRSKGTSYLNEEEKGDSLSL